MCATGSGGGRDKESVLRIMRDSHIGTYGTIGLICYFLLVISVLASLPYPLIALTIIADRSVFKMSAHRNLSIYCRMHAPGGAKTKSAIQNDGISVHQNMLSGCIPLIPLVLTEYRRGRYPSYCLLSPSFASPYISCDGESAAIQEIVAERLFNLRSSHACRKVCITVNLRKPY